MNVPKLRFKEFNDDWNLIRLGDCCNLITKGTTPNRFSESGIKFIKIESLINKKIDNNKCLYVDEKTHITSLKRSILEEKDVLFAIAGATIGKCGIIEKENLPANTNQALAILRTNPKKLDPYFLLNVLDSNIMKKYILLNISVGAQPNLNLEQMNNFKFKLPSEEEQLKVANFLSLLDKKIELQSKKIEDLKLFKKGLSTTIFNSLRNFEEYRLGKICNITTGKLDANAMIDNGKYRFYTCAKEYGLIDKYAFDTEALLISGNGAYVGYIHYYKGKFNAYQRTYVLDNFSQNIQFIKCYLEENLAKRINSEKKEGNTPYIVLSTLSDMVIKIPSKENQIKISNIINCHNKKIELEENKLLKLQELKKGLMQSMFV